MEKTYKIAVLPGDGIGPEVTAEAVKVIEATGLSFEYLECSVGGKEYLKNGESLPDEAIGTVNESDAVFFGAVGHELVPDHISRQVLIFLRMEKDAYANARARNDHEQLQGYQVAVDELPHPHDLDPFE
jgi:3-isopropylmalate dehydrogenase